MDLRAVRSQSDSVWRLLIAFSAQLEETGRAPEAPGAVPTRQMLAYRPRPLMRRAPLFRLYRSLLVTSLTLAPARRVLALLIPLRRRSPGRSIPATTHHLTQPRLVQGRPG